MSSRESSFDAFSPTDPEALDRLLNAAIDVFDIPMQESWLADARAFLGVVASASDQVRSLDLGDEAEPASVYRP